MSSTTNLTLLAQQLTIYIGIPILVFGIIGNTLNIIIFLSLKTFRRSPCAFYLTIVSLANFGQMCMGLFSRIIITGFLIDWTQISLIYCKFRMYFLIASGLISNTSLALAIADQYMATSRRQKWQTCSNIRLARLLSTIFIFIWFFHCIPYLIFFNHIPTSVPGRFACMSTNLIFTQYRIYFVGFILAGFLPLVITVVFGILAYVNVRRIAYRTIPLVRRELDKQLTAMTLLHVSINSLATFPYVIMNVLISNTTLTNNPTYGPPIQFTFTLSTLILYLSIASPFYLYTSVSDRFRNQLQHAFHRSMFHRRQPTVRDGQITADTT